MKVFGSIVGDIVGSRFEFNNYLGTDFKLFTDDCAFTDDSICTIAVADAILKSIPFDQSLRYWCNKYPNPKGSYGMSFSGWFRSPDSTPYNSYGHGSALRVSPCALFYSNNLPKAREAAMFSAASTHNHPAGIIGALAVTD